MLTLLHFLPGTEYYFLVRTAQFAGLAAAFENRAELWRVSKIMEKMSIENTMKWKFHWVVHWLAPFHLCALSPKWPMSFHLSTFVPFHLCALMSIHPCPCTLLPVYPYTLSPVHSFTQAPFHLSSLSKPIENNVFGSPTSISETRFFGFTPTLPHHGGHKGRWKLGFWFPITSQCKQFKHVQSII